MKSIDKEAACTCKELSSEQLEMALSYLMSRFSTQPEERLAEAVLHHLEMLVEHTDPLLSSAKRKHYAQLLNIWWLNTSDGKSTKQVNMTTSVENGPLIRH